MLFEVGGSDRLIDPVKLAGNLFLERGQDKIHPISWQKMVATVDHIINTIKPSKNSQLVWTKTSKLLGDGSHGKHSDVEHFWEKAEEIFTEDRECSIFVGTFVMWRIASSSIESWLCYKIKMDRVDEITGNDLHYYSYWIDKAFVPKNRSKKHTVTDLMTKFNTRK